MRIVEGDMRTYTVLARARVGVTPSDSTDITALREAYTLNISKAEVTETQMEWGTEIARPIIGGVTTGRTPRSLALLVVRSPESGQVYTFVSDTVPSDDTLRDLDASMVPSFLSDMVTTTNQGAATVCIESSGLFVNGQMALYINPYATSTSAIELVSNQTQAARGASTSC